MVAGVVSRLDAKPLAVQLVVIAAVVDPLGAATGYVVLPQYGLEPMVGMAVGLVAASSVLAVWLLRYVYTNEPPVEGRTAE